MKTVCWPSRSTTPAPIFIPACHIKSSLAFCTPPPKAHSTTNTFVADTDEAAMRKTMSLRQLTANRRNAQKSTGPKTPNGKAVSKLNALKHGLLAQSVIVQGHKFKESPCEFKKLCQEFYNELAPVGPLEELLVNQIVQATWRLRRARKAESGEIALSVDTGWWKREGHNPLPMILNMPRTFLSEPLVTQLERSVWCCRYLHHCLHGLREDVERDGELTEAALKD